MRVVRKLKENKEMQIGRKKVIVSLFMDSMIVYISEPKNSTRKTPIADKHLQQSNRKQNQSTKPSSLPKHK